MPRYNFTNVGELQKNVFLRGTIQSVDSATDTCTVNVATIGVVSALLFYHCNPDSVLRSNGAIVGAAAGFTVGDEVVVQWNIEHREALVVAHVGGAKKCGFQFTFTRGDGTPIDDGLLTSLTFYNSRNVLIDTIYTYNAASRVFSVTFDNPNNGNDPNGYWVSYSCTDGITTQYPYRYKFADRRKIADLITAGSYKDIIPYWKVFYTPENRQGFGPSAVEIDYDLMNFTVDGSVEYKIGLYRMIKAGMNYTRSLSVASSVPYRLGFGLSPHPYFFGYNEVGSDGAGGAAWPNHITTAEYRLVSDAGTLLWDGFTHAQGSAQSMESSVYAANTFVSPPSSTPVVHVLNITQNFQPSFEWGYWRDVPPYDWVPTVNNYVYFVLYEFPSITAVPN